MTDFRVGDAARFQYYKNGSQVTLTYNAAMPATLGDSGAALVTIGGSAGLGGFMDMKFALLKAWPGVSLTAAEVAQEYNSFRPARTSSCTLWSPYDDPTNPKDYSGSGNHGTVTGAVFSPTSRPPVSYGG